MIELTEFTSGKNAELEKTLAESQTSIDKLEKELLRSEATIDDLKNQISGLEGQLDKAGGDVAEERKAMRNLERMNQELVEEVRKKRICAGTQA